MNKLSHQEISVSVPGKIILIGEHSVVYGHSALAMPLHNVRLTLSIFPDEHSTWNDAWKIQMQGKPVELSEHFKNLLTQALTLTLSFFHRNISEFTPQTLSIDSQIPLGGGMGGSAAVSASLIKLFCKIFENKNQSSDYEMTLERQIEFANHIDSLFHAGRASGLDVSTILSEKLIQFQKGKPFKVIDHKCSFYIALIDSMERSETSAMIQKVAHSIEQKNSNVQNALQTLGELATACEKCLTQNNIIEFANNLNLAQNSLEKLGVSTKTLNSLCQGLRQQGALCAKLTGAGGGGLVLAIFDKNPDFLYSIYPAERIFITRV